MRTHYLRVSQIVLMHRIAAQRDGRCESRSVYSATEEVGLSCDRLEDYILRVNVRITLRNVSFFLHTQDLVLTAHEAVVNILLRRLKHPLYLPRSV
jgi:hypothetical protein